MWSNRFRASSNNKISCRTGVILLTEDTRPRDCHSSRAARYSFAEVGYFWRASHITPRQGYQRDSEQAPPAGWRCGIGARKGGGGPFFPCVYAIPSKYLGGSVWRGQNPPSPLFDVIVALESGDPPMRVRWLKNVRVLTFHSRVRESYGRTTFR